MFQTMFCVSPLMMVMVMTEARHLTSGNLFESGALNFKSPEINRGIMSSQEYTNLDAEKWKDLLAQGKVRDMLDNIQRSLGSKNRIHMRTKWGGPEPDDLGNAIQNTIKWDAYKGEKANLNVVVDSKIARNNEKVDFINPNLGLTFQIKY